MSKLQCVVNGQTIRFMPLAKVFGDLGTDLPSGAIKLENGELAYWRLERDLKELRNHQRNMTPLLEGLAKGLERLVRSQAFLDHYGIASAPKLEPLPRVIGTMRGLVQLNVDRSSYTTTYYGGNKSLVENIQIPLGNLVFFSAYRGLEKEITAKGMRGRIWMDSDYQDSFFDFVVISPVVKLGDYITPERLAKEITTKICQNFPGMVGKVHIEFAGNHSDGYTQARLAELVDKKSSSSNKNAKKAGQKKEASSAKRGEGGVVVPVDEVAAIRVHVVAEGESLSKIAHRYYANGKMWRAIYVQNSDVIDDPDLIHPKQEIKIPHRSVAERIMRQISGEDTSICEEACANAIAKVVPKDQATKIQNSDLSGATPSPSNPLEPEVENAEKAEAGPEVERDAVEQNVEGVDNAAPSPEEGGEAAAKADEASDTQG